MNVTTLIQDLRERVRAKSDSELASLLGVKRSAVSHWKMRGVIPQKAILKVEAIERARNRLGRYSNYLSKLSEETIFFGKALAILYCGKSSSYREGGEIITDPERLRTATLEFEDFCAAGAYLIANSGRPTAWEAFSRLSNSQFLVQDMREATLLGHMAHLADDAS